jgi:two-component system, OmpR family, sensor histidine kinase SenX3
VSIVDALLVLGLVAAIVVAAWAVRRRRHLERDVDSALAVVGVRSGPDRGWALARSLSELRERAEESEAETARFRAVIERTDLGVIVADHMGNVVFANPAGRAALDGKVGDATARNRLTRLIRRVSSTGNAEQQEFDVYTPVRRFMRLRAVPLPGGAKWGHAAVVYIRDLSGQRRVEAMRRDFLANAGHEMKTPLGALSILAETIAYTDDSATRQRLADRIRSEANRMAQVVDDIVALAAIESLETPFEPVRIVDVVDEAVARVAVLSNETGVPIEIEDHAAGVVVDGNAEQLTSAVANLLSNAVKYSPVGGGAVVSATISSDETEVAISIRDHGIGISSDHLDRIFERFYRVQAGRGRSSGGTGLGLSIVRNVAETHGGSVSVESTPAEGSTFTLRLPVARR